jgi:hypothetical protein
MLQAIRVVSSLEWKTHINTNNACTGFLPIVRRENCRPGLAIRIVSPDFADGLCTGFSPTVRLKKYRAGLVFSLNISSGPTSSSSANVPCTGSLPLVVLESGRPSLEMRPTSPTDRPVQVSSTGHVLASRLLLFRRINQ